ncbi:hypothetical protein OG21DRAFT_1506977 [Imleria badia]|nr:hypothetical protein OG21DRAFT_1506977 [Imleria badia]
MHFSIFALLSAALGVVNALPAENLQARDPSEAVSIPVKPLWQRISANVQTRFHSAISRSYGMLQPLQVSLTFYAGPEPVAAAQ